MVCGNVNHDDSRQLSRSQPDPNSIDKEERCDDSPTELRRREQGNPGNTNQLKKYTDLNSACRGKFPAQCATDSGCHEGSAGKPQQDQPGGNCAKTKHVLKPQRNCEKNSELAHRNDGRRNRAVSERRDSEKVEVKKNVLVLCFAPLFPPHKDEGGDDCDCKRHGNDRDSVGWPLKVTNHEGACRLRHPPAVDSAFDERKNER